MSGAIKNWIPAEYREDDGTRMKGNIELEFLKDKTAISATKSK